MKVRIMIGATAAYACIETESINVDIKLAPGRSAQKALREFAEEQATKATRLMRTANLATEAALKLEKELS